MSDTLNKDLYYRITDLPDAQAITGTEVVEAIQGGKNVKFTLAQLLVAGDSAYAVALENGFLGSEAAWLKSLVGLNAYEVAVKAGYAGTQADWLLSLIGKDGADGNDGADGQDGANGKSPYELAVIAGFEGTEIQWLDSLIGASALDVLAAQYPEITDAASMAAFLKGEKGDKGDRGVATRIVGTVLTKEDLPDATASEAANEAYIVGKHIYVALAGQWEDMGDLSGPEGTGLRIKGSLWDVSLLPSENNIEGDTYVINRALHVWDGTAWVLFGQEGPTGRSAYEEAVKQGFVGSAIVWLESLKGDKGEQGDKGDTGPKGDNADALRLKGQLNNISELPEVATNGDAYVIGSNIVAYTTTGWKDLGRFNGASAYEIAVEQGYEGGPLQWLASLNGTNGTDGIDGKSAFEIAQAAGFEGPESSWLESLHGRDLEIHGAVDSVEALPSAPNVGEAVLCYMVGPILYVGSNGNWKSAGAIKGADGTNGVDGVGVIDALSAQYPEVVDAVSLAAFLKGGEGEKGDKGDTGDQGAAGPSLNVRGVFATEDEVMALADAANGDFAVAANFHYIHDGVTWVKTATFNGADGQDGTDGIDGTNGKDGAGIIVKGELAQSGELPGDAILGDAYLINGEIWFKGSAGWYNAGPLKGLDGKSAYEMAVDAGFVGSQAEWLEQVNGTDGKSAFEIAKEYNPELVDEPSWLAALVGPQGEVGPMGPGVKIMGKLASSADLPAASGYAAGDGFLINGNFWGKAGTEWVDCGPIAGPKGDQGIQGIQGVKGNPGNKGDRGSSIILLDTDPGVLDGAVTDVAMNTVTQGLWLKTSLTNWTFIGNFGGGNVYSPANDGKQYIRVGSEWKQFNHYDLVATPTTGACDISEANVFKLDNSTAAAKTVSLLSPPAGRATTIVILISGNAGAVTWPAPSATFTWSDNMPPELGTKLTNIVFLWDGAQFVGSVGAKA